MARAGERARSQDVFALLRANILAGDHPPATRLPFASLLETYGCSAGSMREALQRLVAEGFVESVEQQGFRVITLSQADLEDLTDARAEIETAALSRALRDGDLTWEAGLVAAHHVLDQLNAVDPSDPHRFNPAWAQAHVAFHEALLSGCSNRRLRTVAVTLRDTAEIYRRWSVPGTGRAQRNSRAEHAALLKATLRRDDAAVVLLREHILRSRFVFESSIGAASEHLRTLELHDSTAGATSPADRAAS